MPSFATTSKARKRPPSKAGSLERRLLAYSTAAGVALSLAPDATAQTNNRLAGPQVFGGVSLEQATPASWEGRTVQRLANDPSVVVVDGPDIVLDASTDAAPDPATAISRFDQAIDIDGDGFDDIIFIHRERRNTATPFFGQGLWFVGGGTYAASVVGYVAGNYYYASALSSGAPISSGQNLINNRPVPVPPAPAPGSYYFGTLATNIDGGATFGPWAGQDAYVGVQFTSSLTGPLTRHFGWIRLEFDAAINTIVIKSWAFDSDPLDAINAAEIPVELTSFDAVMDGEAVVLDWKTASETVNAGFEVQMRTGGSLEFRTLDFVEGAGTTTEAQAYSFRVADLQPGTYAFRLKQVDFDGAFEYSQEVEAKVAVQETHLLSEVYPNPFARQATLDLAVREAQDVRVEVFNMVGQRVATLLDGAMEANVSTPVALDAAGLPGGLYLVRVTGENFQDTRKVTITH